jgi:hypothetical protein
LHGIESLGLLVSLPSCDNLPLIGTFLPQVSVESNGTCLLHTSRETPKSKEAHTKVPYLGGFQVLGGAEHCPE